MSSLSARVIQVVKPGGHDRLKVKELKLRQPAEGEVVVDVAGCGVNFGDVAVRLGVYSAVKKYPAVPGFEFAGTIQGTDEKVFGVTRFGGYTDRLVTSRDLLWPVPEGWTLEQAAGFPAVFLTAQHAIRRVARIEAGETALVHSAAGGMGLALTQVLKARGVRVLGVVGNAQKADVAKEYGIDHVVVRDEGREWSQLDALAPNGFDVIFDANGGPGLKEGYARLAPAGRLVVYGAANMLERGESRLQWRKLAWKYVTRPTFDPLQMVQDNKGVLGFNVVYLFEQKETFRSLMSELLEFIAAGKIRPLPVTTFPFVDPARAHRAIESGSTVGKLVLTVG